MKILLTGAGGQVARALVAEAAKTNKHEIFSFSHQKLDITNLPMVEQAVAQIRPDAVINAAAYNFVDQAEVEHEKAFAVNKTGPENLAKATAARNLPLVHLSSDYVFDGTAKMPYVESSKPNPISTYGKSKLAGEKAVFEQNSRATVVRTSWVYNMGGRNFLLTMLALKDKPDLRVVNDQFGCPTYAPHLAKKLLDFVAAGDDPGIYHIAGDGSTSWFELAHLFFEEMGVKVPIVPISAKEYPYRAPRPRYTVLATVKGVRYKLPRWEQGVKEFVKELRLTTRI